MEYDWRIVRRSDSIVILDTLVSSSNSASTSGDALIIIKNALSPDYYDISCNASNLKYFGSVIKTYATTMVLNTTVNFTVSPVTGTA